MFPPSPQGSGPTGPVFKPRWVMFWRVPPLATVLVAGQQWTVVRKGWSPEKLAYVLALWRYQPDEDTPAQGTVQRAWLEGAPWHRVVVTNDGGFYYQKE